MGGAYGIGAPNEVLISEAPLMRCYGHSPNTERACTSMLLTAAPALPSNEGEGFAPFESSEWETPMYVALYGCETDTAP